MRYAIDPVGWEEAQLHQRDNESRIGSRNNCRSSHLKLIAAVHLLDNWEDLTFDQITAIFGIDVQKVSHFGYLDGQVFKDRMKDIFATSLQLEKYSKASVNQQIVRGHWESPSMRSVLTCFSEFGNPLISKLNAMRINYNRGGIFKIHRIFKRSQSYTTMIDIDILVDNVRNEDQLKKLREWHYKALSFEAQTANVTELNQWCLNLDQDVADIVNGIGRVY